MDTTGNSPKTNDFNTLNIVAKLAEIKIETVEIVSQWLLITYDLPHTPEGDKARRKFLTEAALIGATQHTASVYYMPWTPEAESLAIDLAKIGKACVWSSRPSEILDCEKLTEQYDKKLENILDKILAEVEKIAKHYKNGHDKQVKRMSIKLRRRLSKLKDAIMRRGSPSIMIYAFSIERRLNTMI